MLRGLHEGATTGARAGGGRPAAVQREGKRDDEGAVADLRDHFDSPRSVFISSL